MNIETYLEETKKVVEQISREDLHSLLEGLSNLKNSNGRLFIIGVGGSAANASHAVNDFRKIAEIDACTPLDNVSELTARINDDGWDSCITNTLRVSNFSKNVNGKVFGIVSRDGGMTAKIADACVIIPTVNKKTITPHAEEFQAVVWHMLVTLLGEQ